MCEPVATARAAGSAPIHRAKMFPMASCPTVSPASWQREIIQARALKSVRVKAILVTAGGSASEMAASVSISEFSRC